MTSTARLLWIADPGLPPPATPPDWQGTLYAAHGVAEALEYLRTESIDITVACLPLAEWTPVELLEELQRCGEAPVVIVDPTARASDGVRLARLGAYDCLEHAPSWDELQQRLESLLEDRHSRQLGLLGRSLSNDRWKRLLIGESRPIKDVERIIRLVGPRRCTVLISGETGTGKEMAARSLHMASNRSQHPMVAVNCSALPENLLEAELFGHTKGAFTGATGLRVGRFEQAHGSTLLLDEVGELPFDLQAKLLRVLQEREFQRLGSSETVRVDVRVIAASNVNLQQKVKRGEFREDLYYRLNVVPIQMPPLRERAGDIPLLVRHFIEKICRAEDMPVKRIHRESLDRLGRYSWPGNVRQLENAVEMAVVMSGDRDILFPADFALPAAPEIEAARRRTSSVLTVPDDGLDFEQAVVQFQRNLLDQALRKTSGNKSLAADMLRLPRTTLISKLRALDQTTQ